MNVSTLKNAFGRTRLLAVLCSLLFVFAVACGDDDDNGNNGGASNGTADAGDAGDTDQQDSGDNDTGDANNDTGDANNDTGDANNDTGNPQCEPLSPPPFDDTQCSILCQGCPDGQGCYGGQVQGQDTTASACQPAGTLGQGESCANAAECQPGLTCTQLEGDDSGVCRAYCRPGSEEPPQCGDNARCLGLADPNGNTLPYGVCNVLQDSCTLLDDASCPDAGTSCAFTASGNACVTYNDAASAGDACTTSSDCNVNQQCTNIGDGSQCYDLCNQDNPCEDTNTACTQIASQDEPDNVLFSACVAQ